MTASFEISTAGLQQMRDDLFGTVEHVGFFLADYDSGERRFKLDEWIAIPSEGFEFQSSYHVSLTDETIALVLGRATAAECSLVEVHSHLGEAGAEFSPSDIFGLREWVPQMRWRLRQRPYAAMVWEEHSFDALAWIETSGAEQVTEISVSGSEAIPATGLTLVELRRQEGDRVSL
jgi:hypothetical protein